ncbi:ABC transporter ATP-binding protein [Streptomyces sp. NBC_00441]|uniref:ABC transporter ATP-binding protein n=1 Tax=Streptomyces sp. NBC_00441 TaxID=2975742 RepID=UPI002E2E610F|nr:ABC transporter ATP-binding protein [Streptomyces sp. NBC_00441]
MTAIEIRGLGRVYGRGATAPAALRDVDLTVRQGEVHGLLGPNGAGKSTLCKILSTVLLPSSGTASVLGHDVVVDTEAVKRLVGLVLGGDKGLYNRLTARQNMSFWAALYGVGRRERGRRVDPLLDRVGLTARADDTVHTFSRGMKQRLHLARALVSDPQVLILDEPTAGMDPVAARDFRELVRELRSDGRTVLLTTHDMAEAADLSDRVSFIDSGRLRLTESPDRVGELVSRNRRVTARDVPAPLREQLAALPGVVTVTAPEGRTTRIVTESAEASRTVVHALVDAGIGELDCGTAGLEEAYLHLFGGRGMAVGE